jgi:hypothetical protein
MPGSSSSAEEATTEFFFAALAAGSEGLMMKLLDGPGGALQLKLNLLPAHAQASRMFKHHVCALLQCLVRFAYVSICSCAQCRCTLQTSSFLVAPFDTTHLRCVLPAGRLCVPDGASWAVVGEAEA